MVAQRPNKRRRLSPSAKSLQTSPSTLVDSSDAPGVDDYFTNASRWNLEQAYEARPRKTKKKDRDNTRLPIKTAEGRIEQLVVPDIKEEEEDSWLDSEDEKETKPIEVQLEDPKISAKQQILDAKEELARVASLINEDPEEHVGGFKTLAAIANSSNITVKRLGLATQLTVYKDVIPGYRIRPMGDSDMTEKVSRDVRKLRAFEQGLVGSYQIYVRDLARHAKSSRGDTSEAIASLATVAISCACTLLLAVPHFNFRGDLIKILVTKLSGKRIDRDFGKCRETIETLFRDDENGTPSLDAATILTKMIKARNYRIDDSVLNIFLHLRLLSEFSSKGSQYHIDKPTREDVPKGKKPKFKKEFRTKKQRKQVKELKAVTKEFKEADAIVSHEERDRMQAETLKLVFVTYFRILKARVPSLMGAVLEGLAKYAHLINQDFFGDLLEALKDLTTRSNNDNDDDDLDDQSTPDETTPVSMRNATRESLLCIITAFALLEGQDAHKAAAILHLDLSFFTTHLYRSLYSLALDPDLELSARTLRLPDPHSSAHAPLSTLAVPAKSKINYQTTPALLLRALTSILLPPLAARSVPPVRIAAFSKQLMASSLHMPEKSAMAIMGLLGQVVKIHGRKIGGMWNTEERKGDGEFDALRGEVEGSNPFASTVWEGELLRLHYATGVRDGLGVVERGLEVGV
ncbi:hypothetical protein MMC19_004787 [Ptychographa xylographoides]|nr:hypothetical protein [Ptychographa xylographoides]